MILFNYLIKLEIILNRQIQIINLRFEKNYYSIKSTHYTSS